MTGCGGRTRNLSSVGNKVPMCPDGCCRSRFNLRRESEYDGREFESEPSRCYLSPRSGKDESQYTGAFKLIENGVGGHTISLMVFSTWVA